MIGSTIEVIMTWLKLSDERGEVDFSKYLINEYGDIWSTQNIRLRKHFVTNGYHRIELYVDGKAYKRLVHRLVYHMFRPIDSNILNYQVDHKNLNPGNNHINNLRVSDCSRNRFNTKKYQNCSSRFKGVRWCPRKQKWRCDVWILNKRLFMGLYDSEYESGYVYDQFAKRFHKEFYRNDEFNDCDEHISDERKAELNEYINKRLQKLQID